MSKGTVERWFASRGFGFIHADGHEVFVHARDVEGRRELQDGQAVTFEMVDGEKGLRAVNVRPVND